MNYSQHPASYLGTDSHHFRWIVPPRAGLMGSFPEVPSRQRGYAEARGKVAVPRSASQPSGRLQGCCFPSSIACPPRRAQSWSVSSRSVTVTETGRRQVCKPFPPESMDVRDERERQLSAQSASGGLEAHQDSTGNRVPSAFGRRRQVDIPGDEEMTGASTRRRPCAHGSAFRGLTALQRISLRCF